MPEKQHRRLAITWLHIKEVDKYTHVLDREATDMVKCLFDASKNGTALVNPQTFAGRCSLNVMLTIVFGTRTNTVEDPIVKESLRLSREFM
ncbi:hypothetical protein NHQ30_011029 [Ciborinia camelliae]|nr:hypothetical protein NHQ30_011029 [Ciborinia camelliae]